MPEAAMNEDNDAVKREYEIRPAGKIATMQTEAQTPRMEASAKEHLRFRIPSANAAHIEPPLIGCQNISHAVLKLRYQR
jgi:hypothetical protein